MPESKNAVELAGENNDPEVPADERTTVIFYGPLTVPMGGINYEAKVMRFGDELDVTDELREAGTDRTGSSWLDWIDDPDAQRMRWGKVLYQRGPWPEGKSRIEPGSEQWADRRDLLRREAFAIHDPRARAERLRLIDDLYGRPLTSVTTKTFRTPGEGW